MNISIKLFFLLLLISCTLSLKGIGLNPIKPYYLNQGQSTSYLFLLTPEEEILTKGQIKISFPYEFDQATLAASLSCMAKSESYDWKSVTCSYIE
jgi:hypothetical protein